MATWLKGAAQAAGATRASPPPHSIEMLVSPGRPAEGLVHIAALLTIIIEGFAKNPPTHNTSQEPDSSEHITSQKPDLFEHITSQKPESSDDITKTRLI